MMKALSSVQEFSGDVLDLACAPDCGTIALISGLLCPQVDYPAQDISDRQTEDMCIETSYPVSEMM